MITERPRRPAICEERAQALGEAIKRAISSQYPEDINVLLDDAHRIIEVDDRIHNDIFRAYGFDLPGRQVSVKPQALELIRARCLARASGRT